MKKMETALISEDSRKTLNKDFSQLKDPVTIIAFLTEDEKEPFSEFTKKLMTELSGITDKIKPIFEKLDGEAAKKYHVTRAPVMLIQPEKYAIRFFGAPAGEEARTLLISILMTSTGKTMISENSRKRLSDLKEKRNVKIFVSPTCPYCPQQAVYAISASIEKPEYVATEIIEIYENKDLAAKYNAFSVPQTFIDDQLVGSGLQPEEVFIESLITAAPVKLTPVEYGELMERDLLIIGAGPAGLTAAIYAGRSGLKSVVIEKANIGGQVAITPVVENYPGFTKIAGRTLMDMMAQQAIQYSEIHEGEEVLDIRKTDATFEVKTSRSKYSVKSILITTGAESKKLNIPGEKAFQGRGVSYCAACDGYFFKDGKKVIVVGGGNTAATEALYLKNIGVDAIIVHRKDQLRAEDFLQQRLADNKISVMWNSEVLEILGDKIVTGAVIKNTKDQGSKTLSVDGVFIAIGYIPNNNLALKLGIETDDEGYIRVDRMQRTNVNGIYAAGDITGGVKQIVTAVGQGSVAALSIFENISNPYWKKA